MPSISKLICSGSVPGTRWPSSMARRTAFCVMALPRCWFSIAASRIGPGSVVVLDRGRDHDAAAGQAGLDGPVEPALEQGPQAGQAALDLQHRHEHLLAVKLRGMLEHRELQLLARAEMREQAGLRHARGVGQTADGQALETELARDIEGFVEDRGARLLAFGAWRRHAGKIVRTFVKVNPAAAFKACFRYWPV